MKKSWPMIKFGFLIKNRLTKRPKYNTIVGINYMI